MYRVFSNPKIFEEYFNKAKSLMNFNLIAFLRLQIKLAEFKHFPKEETRVMSGLSKCPLDYIICIANIPVVVLFCM
jgi:hypothetical protein